MPVIDIIREQDEMKAHSHQFVLWRRKWQQYTCPSQLVWTIYRLRESERANIPDTAGIYTLLVQPGIASHPWCSYLMYVGQTRSLYRRFGEYLRDERRETGRPKIFRLLTMYSDYLWFCFSPVPIQELDSVEDALITAYMPPANDQVPAEVRQVRGAF